MEMLILIVAGMLIHSSLVALVEPLSLRLMDIFRILLEKRQLPAKAQPNSTMWMSVPSIPRALYTRVDYSLARSSSPLRMGRQ
ncbi:hypothetical protein BDZ97DRAFT_1843824 [Flammula alnicola]|nr:hypothetical protein BDZ97DRAFT_1843824 [Flammula alnicola]